MDHRQSRMSVKEDSLYSKVEGEKTEDYVYEPTYFVRSHCRNDNEADGDTQVWDVAFEPGLGGGVATCGGAFLCMFNVSTGELVRKYSHKERNHELFCLAWTSLPHGNFIASGSSSGEVRLYHPERLVSFHSWTPKKGQALNALKFHDRQSSWLFAASSPRGVSLWDIHNPSPPDYMKQSQSLLLRVILEDCPIYSMTWVDHTRWLLVGGARGMLGWWVEEAKVRDGSFPKYQPKTVELKLPGGETDQGPYVDSVTSLGEGLVAAKCVGFGKIFVFKAQFSVKAGSNLAKVEVLAQYAWHKTSNFYMNIGGDVHLRMMGCGDDTGCIWLYSLPSWLCDYDEVINSGDENRLPSHLPAKLMPLGRLPWPEVKDDQSGTGPRQTMLDKVAFSPCGQYIVAVTNTNIVAFWKKVEKTSHQLDTSSDCDTDQQ